MTTLHSLQRAKERIGLNEKRAKKNIQFALERGKTAEQFPSLEKKYLQKTARGNCHAIAYNGYCYIVDNRNFCVTVYALPIWFERKKHYDGKKKIRNYKSYMKNTVNLITPIETYESIQ